MHIASSSSSSRASSTDFSASLSLSLSLCPYHPPLMAGLSNYIQCSNKADVNMFLQVNLYWRVHVQRSIEEHHLWFRSWFPNTVQHVLLVLLVWSVRWDISDRTTAVSWGVASWICIKIARSIDGETQECCPHLVFCPVGWSCRIHPLLLCKGVRSPL